MTMSVTEEREQTDGILIRFLCSRMSPKEALAYLEEMERNPDTRYPRLPEEKDGARSDQTHS